MNTKNNSRSRNTKLKIQNTYLMLITEASDKPVKVVDLCKKANINRATFYAHYYDINQVSEELQAQIISELIDFIAPKEDLLIDLAELFTKFFELIKTHKKFFYYTFVIANNPDSLNVLYLPPISQKIQHWQDKNQVTIDFKMQMDFFNGGTASIVKNWLIEDCATPISQIVELLTRKISFLDSF